MQSRLTGRCQLNLASVTCSLGEVLFEVSWNRREFAEALMNAHRCRECASLRPERTTMSGRGSGERRRRRSPPPAPRRRRQCGAVGSNAAVQSSEVAGATSLPCAAASSLRLQRDASGPSSRTSTGGVPLSADPLRARSFRPILNTDKTPRHSPISLGGGSWAGELHPMLARLVRSCLGRGPRHLRPFSPFGLCPPCE